MLNFPKMAIIEKCRWKGHIGTYIGGIVIIESGFWRSSTDRVTASICQLIRAIRSPCSLEIGNHSTDLFSTNQQKNLIYKVKWCTMHSCSLLSENILGRYFWRTRRSTASPQVTQPKWVTFWKRCSIIYKVTFIIAGRPPVNLKK